MRISDWSSDVCSSDLSPIIHYYLSRNRIWFLRKYANRLCSPIVIIENVVYYTSLLIYFTIRRRWGKANYLLSGIKDGLSTSQKTIWNKTIGRAECRERVCKEV